MAFMRSAAVLETILLRRGVGRLTAGRARCSDCRRTPLVGERVHFYENGSVRCELCRARRSDRPVRSEAVRGAELGHAVRPHLREAA
jgi:hypothetical protein